MCYFEIKTENKGTGTPFVARLLFTILQFRDQTGVDDDRKCIFDDIYKRFYDHAENAYLSYIELREIHKKYIDEVYAGKIVSKQKNVLLIGKTIDTEARRLTYSILSEAEIAFKDLINLYDKMFDAPSLGFMAQNDKMFKKGIINIREKDLNLANYLESNRKEWTGRLSEIRNKKEHGGWCLSEYHFTTDNGVLLVACPMIDGKFYLEYLQFLLASLFTFAEELMVYALNMCIEYGYVYEIPKCERKKDVATRFNMCFVRDEHEPWILKYNGPDVDLLL